MKLSIRHLSAGIAVLALAALQAGCTSLVVSAGATAGSAAMQERGFKAAVTDTVIHAKIVAAYLKDSIYFKLIGIEAHQGRVLLTGTTPRAKDRVDAIRLAWQVDGVKSVINEISIEDGGDILELARDKWVSAQLRLKITFDAKIKAINYAIDTVDGTVYLMGIAQNQAELNRVKNHAHALDYVRRIVSHVRFKKPPMNP
jgi:osmotically-inducible protein OsmY